jgi:hypothetical protein
MATTECRAGAEDYWDAQEQTLAALSSGDYDLVVFRAGYAGGKTLLAADWIHMVAMQHPESDNLIMAPDYQKGGPATYKTFFNRLPGTNTVPDQGGDPENSPVVADYNRNEKRCTYVNGSVARLGSADKWNRYAGSEFNAIACDEPAHYDTTDLYDLVEMLTSRQRTHAGPNVMLWTSTGAGFNDYYDITERQVAADGESDLPWADRMTVIVGDSRNNPFLPADAREKLRRQFEGTDREAQALAGGFAAPTGLVYADFSRTRHVVGPDSPTECPPITEGWRCYGYDHGWDDPRVVLEVGLSNYDQLVVMDEFYKENTEYQRAVEWLSERPTGTVYAEHEPEHQQAFRRAGYRVEPAVKDLDEGIPAVRDRLDWRDDPEDRPGLLVHEDCVNTIREFQDYQEDEVGTASAVDHAMDALRYVVMGEDGTSREGGGVVIDW